MNPETEDILKKYKKKLESEIDVENYQDDDSFSREYEIFRKELISFNLTLYEKLCQISESIIKIRPNEKDQALLEDVIEHSHLKITTSGAASFATIVSLLIILFGIGYGVLGFVFGNNPLFLPLTIIVIGAIALKPLTKIPVYVASRWRLKASNQMVLCILYVVMYMRHTSNLEHAIKFAADHIGNPLALDLRKIIWDVETERFTTVKESLDHYLESWKSWNDEFIESFHLIESSLYESSQSRRLSVIEKALEVILDGTYEKMLHYAQDLRNPVTMLHMLGVVLPILGLIMFPLVASFLGGSIKWWHLSILYNFALPIMVLVIGVNILSKRPTGYGEYDVLKGVPGLKQQTKLNVLGLKLTSNLAGISIFLFFFFLGIMPILVHLNKPSLDINLGVLGNFLDYKNGSGPYGVGALLFSFFVPLGIALGISSGYYINTRRLIKGREETKKLEKEFTGSLFQLGNRVAEGIPVELAFSRVASSTKHMLTGQFFEKVSDNLSRSGMSLNDAIFHPERGAILLYPSALIESSMKVLMQSSKKGTQVVAQSLLSISDYVSRIHKVDERLKDLLADIISSMKSQISFLTPLIAGIVVGLASMIVTIIGKLGQQFENLPDATGSQLNIGALVEIFKIEDIIPSYYFQIVVGVYVVQVIILLTILYNGIENGSDKISEKYLIAKNLFRSTLLYLVISIIVTIIFNILANGILTVTNTI